MTKLLEKLMAEAARLAPEQQEAMARRWLQDLRDDRPQHEAKVDELFRRIRAAARDAKPDAGWRFSREEIYQDRLDRYPKP